MAARMQGFCYGMVNETEKWSMRLKCFIFLLKRFFKNSLLDDDPVAFE